MIWTTTRPQQPGWYWWRWHERDTATIVEVKSQMGFLIFRGMEEPWQTLFFTGEWAGPLPEPEEGA